MNKNVLKLLIPLFAFVFVAGIASAYGYYDDTYKKEYTVKETYDDYGYTFYEKNVDKTPWGEKTTYTKVKDYDGRVNPHRNRVNDYWSDGPYKGYSKKQYLGYAWDDSYQRTLHDTQYNDYYYKPRYYSNGDYYNWEGNEPDCANRNSGRWSSVSYCGNNIYHYSW